MLRGSRRPGRPAFCAAVGILVLASLPACRRDTPPIVVEDRMIKIENQTEQRWSDVRVYLNDHFVAGTPVLEPGGRFHVQQRDFVTAFGQRFDPTRQGPYGVLVTAGTDGEDIQLVWGQPHKR